MKADTEAVLQKPPDDERNKAALRFFTAQIQSYQAALTMRRTISAITDDPVLQKKLVEMIRQLIYANEEFVAKLDSFLPPRSRHQAYFDRAAVRRGLEAENRLCNHIHYNPHSSDPYCTCGTLMRSSPL